MVVPVRDIMERVHGADTEALGELVPTYTNPVCLLVSGTTGENADAHLKRSAAIAALIGAETPQYLDNPTDAVRRP